MPVAVSPVAFRKERLSTLWIMVSSTVDCGFIGEAIEDKFKKVFLLADAKLLNGNLGY
jgi:hypothetical protein